MSAILPTRMVAKPWGCNSLPPPFVAPDGQLIGEVWFEPPPSLPQLLIKYIFTSEKLSVQVHPSDAQLPGHGKEECWLVLDAKPGAALGIGFDRQLSADEMRAAALDGSIEHLLSWHQVQAGDFFYIPAGTVHAIGAGVSLIEVQQTSDVTYRLFDYGRPRKLHLDAGLAVARGLPYPAELHRFVAPTSSQMLVSGPHFRLAQIVGEPDGEVARDFAHGPLLIIPRKRGVMVQGEEIAVGACSLAKSIADIRIAAGGNCLIAQSC